ncbi:MAG TPA: DUF4124 domain-containing protein [Xanthomonadaceae bacterium]|nr:DUF4124 domain-containing protein [Xanthomonadaceae bacterium]
MPLSRPLLALAACLALFPAVATAQASDKVYKWTDANGVTHYGDAPPATGEYEASPIPAEDRATRAPAEPATDAAATAATDEDPQCADVRKHLALLQGDSQVQQDTDGDGKADRILSQADREAQARLAEGMLAKNCTAPAA